MTQATPSQFEELGSIKENVRHNEKAIDRIEAKLQSLEDKLNGLAWKGLLGILILLAANIALKYLP